GVVVAELFAPLSAYCAGVGYHDRSASFKAHVKVLFFAHSHALHSSKSKFFLPFIISYRRISWQGKIDRFLGKRYNNTSIVPFHKVRMEISMSFDRSSGVLMHITSLPSPH